MDRPAWGQRLGSNVTVNFALFLSPEGIALAHRQAAGHWALIAEQPFAVADLAARMADLRTTIALRGGGDAPVLLVLPDDQILYTSFTAPTHDPVLVEDRITAGLDGLTPYAVSDLVFAWRAVEQDRIKVAVIAAETLEEASGFASAHGFVAAGFAAMPPLERFPGMPIFGEASADVAAATADLRFGPDLWAPPEPAAAPAEETPVAAETEAPVAAKDDPPLQAPAPPAPKEAAKRKRQARKTDGEPPTDGRPEADAHAAAQPDAAAPDAAPRPAAPAAPAAPDAPDAATTGAAQEAAPPTPAKSDEAVPTTSANADEAPAEEASVATKAKPDEAPAEEASVAPKAKAEDATGPEAPDDADPPPEMGALAALLDPMFNRTITPIDAALEDPEPGKSDDAPPAEPVVPVTETSADALETPEDIAAPRPDRSQPATEDAADPQSRPLFGFSTKRRPSRKQAKAVAAEMGEAASKIVTDMRGRLGLAAKPVATDTPRHPDVTIAPPRRVATAPQGNDLVAQLARLRDVSKARPKDKAAPPADAPALPTAASAAPDTPPPLDRAMGADDTPPRATSDSAPPRATSDSAPPRATSDSAPPRATSDSAPPRATLGSTTSDKAPPRPAFGNPLSRATTGATQPRAKQALPFAAESADAALVSGLLARKPSQPQGPSMRTGLVLTLALLVLLILIAVWSVVFLPDSPMARLFGTGDTAATAQADGDIEPPSPALPETAPAVADTTPPVDPEALADTEFAEDIAPAAPPAPEPAVAPPLPTPVATLPPLDADQTLPGIDADLDLPPLPPLPDTALPSIAEAEALYASQRIWQRPPDRPAFSPFTLTDDIYIASIDPEIAAVDAVALADPRIDAREVLRRVPTPPPFGARLNRDARGLITPTAEGVLTPEGAFVILGQPAVAAIPRPREIAPTPQAPAAILNVEDAILRAIQPRPRPINLDETRERQLLGGFSRTELAAMRPTSRPVSAQEDAARASLFPQSQTADTGSATLVGATARAVAASRVPRARPADFATTVAAATRQPAAPATVTAAAFAPAPSIPSNADVARAATNRNEISLRDINLIGITGTSSNRSALVRLPSGRFVRVAVGDRLDGGRVAAIGTTSLQYVVNGRNITLEIPG
jgi:hypothetical protein